MSSFGGKADIAQEAVTECPDIGPCPVATILGIIELALVGHSPLLADLQSCPRGLAVTDQAVAVPSSEPGQISERVFSDFALLGSIRPSSSPFFFPARAPRFAFLDFFATFNIPIKTMPRRHSRIISQLTRTHRLADIRGLNRNAR